MDLLTVRDGPSNRYDNVTVPAIIKIPAGDNKKCALEEEMKIAVITGASSGLGREFARRIDEQYDVNEIWVIARRLDRLERLAESLTKPVHCIAADLSTREGISAVARELDRAKPVIEILVNAAGFGKIGSYADIPLKEIDQMIDLNCRGAVDMTQICIPYCGHGSHIAEICSTAGFQPFPYLNVYAASKAFLYRYSRALGRELLGDGITVTAVCPYWVKSTEFIGKAKNTKNSSYIKGFPLAEDEHVVVARAMTDINLGLSVSTPGLVCTLHRFFAKILSSNLLMLIWDGIRQIR